MIEYTFNPTVQDAIDQSASAGAAVLSTTSLDEWCHILTRQHHIARNAVPMIRAAANNAEAGGLHSLYDYLAHHAEEEIGHDEWVLEDLEALSSPMPNPALPEDTLTPLSTAIDWHWEQLETGRVWPLLGHMWTIESRPPSEGLILQVMDRIDRPRECARTHLRHAVIDQEHARDLAVQINQYRDDPEAMGGIEQGAYCTALAITRFWLALLRYRDGVSV